MNKMIGIIACGLIAGCVSVEKTRERLASGDAEQIEVAKRDARRMALDSHLPEEERIAYIELLADNDVLYTILTSLRYDEAVQTAAIKKMSFAEEGMAAKFAKDYHDYDSSLRCLSDGVLAVAVSQMCAQADFDDLYAARKTFRIETELENVLTDALLEKATNDVQRVKVFGVCCDDKQAARALEKVKDQNALLDLLCGRIGRCGSPSATVVSALSDETIVGFIRDDARFIRFAEHKGSSCLCEKMKDKTKLCELLIQLDGARAELCYGALAALSDECLVRVIKEAKCEKLKQGACWKVRSSKTAEHLFCDVTLSDKSQWTLAWRLAKGAATRKMYDSARDDKVRKLLLEKMPRELRKEIEK